MITDKQAQIYGNFWQILDLSQKLVNDYESIIKDKELIKKYPRTDSAYIDSIIIHIAKIVSSSYNDSFSLKELKTIYQEEIEKELTAIEEKNKDIIAKIIINRNKLIAHLDKKFFDICYSKKEIQKMMLNMSKIGKFSIEDAKLIYKNFSKSSDKGQERYSIGDFRDDLPQIQKMLNDLDDVWSRSILFIKQ